MHPLFWRFAGLAAPGGPLVAIIKTCAMTTKNLLVWTNYDDVNDVVIK